MKAANCELADEPAFRDENWRLHAAGCWDCREHLVAADWMTALAGSTAMHRELPSPGSLWFRAKIQAKIHAADRAAWPTYVMAPVTGILLLAVTIGLVLGGETRLGTVMKGSFDLLLGYAGLMIVAAAVVSLICASVSYIDKRTDA